jgi:hypothetical protein
MIVQVLLDDPEVIITERLQRPSFFVSSDTLMATVF